jgi:hypothetical protein
MQLINDLESQNDEPYLLIIFKYFVNFLASSYGQNLIGNQKKNDLVNKTIKVFLKTKSNELMQETLSIIWNLLLYPKEPLSNDKNLL